MRGAPYCAMPPHLHKLRAMSQKLTTPQAAKQYGIPERTLQRAITNNELAAERVEVRGGTYMLDPADVAAYAQKWKDRKAARREGTDGGLEVRDTR